MSRKPLLSAPTAWFMRPIAAFLSYAEQIVASSKNVPVMGDLFEAVSSNLKHKVNQEWRELYTRRMDEMESKFPVEAPDFGQASLAASSDAAKVAFEHHNLTAGLQGDVLLHCRDELPLLEGPYAAANAVASQRLCESLYEDAVAIIHVRLRSEQYASVQAFNADRLTAFQKYREHARGPYMPVLLQRFVMLDELQSLQERLHVPNDERLSQREELQQQLEDIDLYLELYQSSMSAEMLRQQKMDIERIQAQLEESYRKDKAQADAKLKVREAQFAQLLITLREESRQKLYEEQQCWKENVEQQKEATEQQRAEDMAKLAEQARRKEEDLQAEKVRAKKMLRNERFKVMAKRLGVVAASSLISTVLSMLYNIPANLLQNM